MDGQGLATDADPLRGLAGTFAATLAVLAVAVAALYQATAGGSAFTTETLRRSAVAAAPVPVPDFDVIDAQGRAGKLLQLLAADGKVWIVDFVYTRCTSLCLSLGTVFQQLQRQIVAQGLQDRIGLLSISFDPLRDQPPALAAYAQRMQMQGGLWQVVSLRRDADRRSLLDSFGIMVLPAPLGEFEHNAALHIVSPQGQLVQILAIGDGANALAWAQAQSRSRSQSQAQPQAQPQPQATR